MPLPRSYQNFAEFEREILRPNRVGFSLEDIVEEEGPSRPSSTSTRTRSTPRTMTERGGAARGMTPTSSHVLAVALGAAAP